MTIEELISELEQYDRELEIHVYSITNDKDSIISHIGRGDDENGELETFVSICTEDNPKNSNAQSKCNLINIKPNPYKPVAEPNIEVVQMICDAFINGDKFRPYTHQYKCYHAATKWVSEGVRNARFTDSKFNSYRIHDCDMKMAFEYLQRAGYNMFAIKEGNGFVEIVCSEKPYYEKNGIFYGRIDKYVEHID